MRGYKHQCELAWKAIRRLKKKKKGCLSASDTSLIFRKYFKWGLSDPRVIYWCYKKFGIETTYSLGYQLRDLALRKPVKIIRAGKSYEPHRKGKPRPDDLLIENEESTIH